MTRTDIDGIVDEYLHRLDMALNPLPAPRRQQLITEITEHLEEARSELPIQTEAAIRELLDRVGQPEEIAAEALADQPERDRRPRRGLVLALVGLAVLLAVGLTLGLVLSSGGPSPAAASFAVPNVVGKSTAEATSQLKSLGVGVRVAQVASGSIAPGVIVSQSPPAGVTIARGSVVALAVASFVPATTTTMATAPSSATSTTTYPGTPPVANGIYVAGSPGTPHYFISLTNGSGGITGSVEFLYQDGQTSVVFTFDGTVQNGMATLNPTGVPQNGGSASQDPATVPSAISATLGQGSISLGECTSYLHFTKSLAQCDFTYSSGGAQ